jgi:hypothetical protein
MLIGSFPASSRGFSAGQVSSDAHFHQFGSFAPGAAAAATAAAAAAGLSSTGVSPAQGGMFDPHRPRHHEQRLSAVSSAGSTEASAASLSASAVGSWRKAAPLRPAEGGGAGGEARGFGGVCGVGDDFEASAVEATDGPFSAVAATPAGGGGDLGGFRDHHGGSLGGGFGGFGGVLRVSTVPSSPSASVSASLGSTQATPNTAAHRRGSQAAPSRKLVISLNADVALSFLF